MGQDRETRTVCCSAMAKKKTKKNPWSPIYWPAWLGFGVLRLIMLLPHAWLVRFGMTVGRIVERLATSRRKIADTNLRACFPEMDQRQRDELITRHFESLGAGFFEIGMAWWKPDQVLKPLAHVHGLENLERARAAGKGVILMSAHFTNVDFTGRLLLLFYADFCAMYRKNENPVVEYVMGRSRDRHTTGAIQSNNIRAMIKALRQGKAVWYASDRNTKRSQAVFVKFFGQMASTNSAASRLSRMTGAKLVPFYGVRRADGNGYDLFVLPALEDFPGESIEADSQRLNDMIEGWVRQYPEQYLWIHRRFRNRPNRDDPPFY